MYPLIKTFTSLKKANLFGLMFACALLALVVVLGAVGSITWTTDRVVTIERGRPGSKLSRVGTRFQMQTA